MTLNVKNGVTSYDLEVRKSLAGTTDLDVQADALGGLVQLNGTLDMTADIVLHVQFGVDANDVFFIDPLNGQAAELSISNIRINGEVEGEGSLGFLGVELTEATLSLDPEIEIAVKLLDPNDDGFVRRNELTGNIRDVADLQLRGNPTADDVVLQATFAVSGGLGESLQLAEAEVRLAWADIKAPDTITVDASVDAGKDLLNFLPRTADEIFAGLENLARWFQDITATDLLATDIPSINASLGELLGETPTPLALDNNELRNVSAVSEAGNFKKFTVEVKAGTNLLEGGVAIGDTVVYRSDGSNVQGEIEAVTPGGFVVRFAKARSQTPDADPSFRIQRRGSLQHQLEAFVDGLRTVFEGGLPVPTLAQGIPAVPTLQGLIETLAEVLGIKPKDAIEKLGVTSTGSGVDRVIQFAPEFNPAAITFDKKLDFGTAIPGLSFDAKRQYRVCHQPALSFTVRHSP